MNDGHLSRPAYLLIAAAGYLLMLSTWYHRYLDKLEPKKNPKQLDDVLSASLLAGLSEHVTPRSAWELSLQDWEGRFICNRLQIPAHDIANAMSDKPEDMIPIWLSAEEI